MRPLIASFLLVALTATQVAAVHCPTPSTAAEAAAAPEASAPEGHREHADTHGDHANEGHDHHGTDGCTMLLACGGPAVPRERPASRGAEGLIIPSELPTPRELRSTLLCADPPPPKLRA